MYVNTEEKEIWKQASSGQFYHFLDLCQRGIILRSQQSTLVRSSLFFDIGGFDDSYKLVADTKFWVQLSLLKPRFRYLNMHASCYTLQKDQLSNDKITQHAEHQRKLDECPVPSKISIRMNEFIYRFLN